VLRELYDLVKFGPTAANTTPARFIFVQSPEAKAKLAALSSGSNGAKILKAPVTVIVGYDLDFPETLDRLFPNAPGAKNWFGDPVAKEVGALRNSSLQGGYFILAARALGLDVGPMSGFDNAGVDAVLRRDQHQVQLHRLDRLRHRRGPVPAQSAPGLRGSREDRLIS
jgi:3-hydroxypropanoate dehydrogenase